MNRQKKKILLTGCCGFIGSNFVKRICKRPDVMEQYDFVILDALTYAGVYSNIAHEVDSCRHIEFIHADIRNRITINKIFETNSFYGVINFAAESHVDRSIKEPGIFVETNVLGVLNLLQASYETCLGHDGFTFLQVSTDEVYGSLEKDDPAFTESTPLAPNSPYSASKAGGDLLVRSFCNTYRLPAIITRCSNNYGPYQFPEKLIPLMIDRANNNQPLPVYGKGENIRDWIYVDDHNDGIWLAFTKGEPGSIYNFGGNSEMLNLAIVKQILETMDKSEGLIRYVKDRPGHDYRYAVDFSKAAQELGWQPKTCFNEGLDKTIKWYLDNNITSKP